METDIEFEEFWRWTKSQIENMKLLDPHRCLVYGASTHHYHVEQVVNYKSILKFERKNKIDLPTSYRSYLLHFGSCGASDFNGTHNFLTKLFKDDVSKPSQLTVFEGVQEIESDSPPHPIENSDGIVQIAKGFNPSVPFLVLNGVASGWVYWWNHDDMVGCLGRFEDWYREWTERTIQILEKHKLVESIPIGSPISSVENMFPDETSIQFQENRKIVRIKDLVYYFELDENDNLIKSCKDPKYT